MTRRFEILIPVMIIFTIGLVMIFNTSSAEMIDHFLGQNTHAALLRQLAYGLLAFCCGWGVYVIGYKKLIQLSPVLLILASILLLLVLIPGIGLVANGSRRWLSIGGMSLQPSEFVKFISLLYFIHRLFLFNKTDFELRDFLKILAPLAIPLLLILVEPNNGTVAVIGFALIGLFFLTQIPMNYWAVPMIALAIVGTVFALHMPYVRSRFEVYLHPERDLKGKGHQPFQAKIASGSGGVFGKGPGASMQKMSYLPEAQNDYIAAIYAEECGFMGVLVLISLYGYLAYLGLKTAFQSQDLAGLYVAASFTFLLSLQAFLNLGVVSGLLPSTGLNLPFFSQGGSSLIANACGLGAILSIMKEQKR